ncbi:MAG: phosphomethylpyrimidine synthase ThiC, partial [Planctomycetota bacterium]
MTANHKTYTLPPIGNDPGLEPDVTTPGSFANTPAILPGTRGARTFSSPDTPGMPPLSNKTAWDFMPEDWTCLVDEHGEWKEGALKSLLDSGREFEPDLKHEQAAAWQAPDGFAPSTQLESARLGIVTPEMKRVAEREEHLSPEQVRDELAAGRLVIPANKVALGYDLDPMCIGRASKTKINANMGASPVSSSTDEEVEKLKWAEQWKADTVMDLSTGGDLDETRVAICKNATVPIGTVPIYSMIIGRKIEDLDYRIIMDGVKNQAEHGVSYFTIHAGILREHVKLAKNRLIGLVSRGGSLLAKWMIHHGKENPFNTAWEDICAVMREYDITFSIGDGCRPGGLADATDELQLAELVEIANLTHLQHHLDPMCIGRASKTKINANMGASPVSSSTDEEVDKLKWAERWGADTVMDLSTGGDLDATRQAIIQNSTTPIGTVPIYSMIIGRKIEDLSEQIILETCEHQAQQGVDYFT